MLDIKNVTMETIVDLAGLGVSQKLEPDWWPENPFPENDRDNRLFWAAVSNQILIAYHHAICEGKIKVVREVDNDKL